MKNIKEDGKKSLIKTRDNIKLREVLRTHILSHSFYDTFGNVSFYPASRLENDYNKYINELEKEFLKSSF